MRWYSGRPVVMMLSLAALVACGGEESASEAGPPPAGEVGGLSREEIEASAAAMDPATAESLGIVDTTIRVERPIPADSAIAPLEPDTSGGPR